jgi:hypothetical protein
LKCRKEEARKLKAKLAQLRTALAELEYNHDIFKDVTAENDSLKRELAECQAANGLLDSQAINLREALDRCQAREAEAENILRDWIKQTECLEAPEVELPNGGCLCVFCELVRESEFFLRNLPTTSTLIPQAELDALREVARISKNYLYSDDHGSDIELEQALSKLDGVREERP